MRAWSGEFDVRSSRRLQIIDVTREVRRLTRESGVSEGIVNVWVPHTTAGLTVNEPDPDLWEDLLETAARLVPPDAKYRHNEKYSGLPGEQNAHAHILSSLIQPGISIPLISGDLGLGTWQAVLLVELDGPRSRRVRVTVLGE